MIENKDVASLLTEIEWIEDKTLQQQVLTVWTKAAEQGKWESLDNVPFTLLFENSGKLTDHTKRITRLAKSILDTREELLNQDYLIAGALLHDVGKLMEYEQKEDGTVVKSEFGKQKRHPVSGSELAEDLGLPKEVVHIIYSHSKEGDSLQRTPESIIVHHCDFIDFEIKKSLV